LQECQRTQKKKIRDFMSIEMKSGSISRTGETAASAEAIPGYEALREKFQEGEIWNRKHLMAEEKLIAILSCLVMEQRLFSFSEKVNVALDQGVAPRALSEVVLQAGLYGGMPLVETMSEILGQIFQERNLQPDPELLPEQDSESLMESALEYRQALHGERSQTNHADPSNQQTLELYSLTTSFGYGLVWRRPGLSVRKRFIVAMACFAAMGCVENFFKKFALSAIEHNFNAQDIREVLIQISPYIGFPRALQALALVKPDTESES